MALDLSVTQMPECHYTISDIDSDSSVSLGYLYSPYTRSNTSPPSWPTKESVNLLLQQLQQEIPQLQREFGIESTVPSIASDNEDDDVICIDDISEPAFTANEVLSVVVANDHATVDQQQQRPQQHIQMENLIQPIEVEAQVSGVELLQLRAHQQVDAPMNERRGAMEYLREKVDKWLNDCSNDFKIPCFNGQYMSEPEHASASQFRVVVPRNLESGATYTRFKGTNSKANVIASQPQNTIGNVASLVSTPTRPPPQLIPLSTPATVVAVSEPVTLPAPVVSSTRTRNNATQVNTLPMPQTCESSIQVNTWSPIPVLRTCETSTQVELMDLQNSSSLPQSQIDSLNRQMLNGEIYEVDDDDQEVLSSEAQANRNTNANNNLLIMRRTTVNRLLRYKIKANTTLCQICFTRERDCVMLPCRHLLTCHECAKNWRQHNRRSNGTATCPGCRKPFKSLQKIYYS